MSTASAYLTVRGIDVDVVYKDIKNLHIGVYPPMGRVRVAAPERLDEDADPPGRRPAPAVDQAAARAAPGRRAPVRARDGHRRVALRLGQSPPPQSHRAARARAHVEVDGDRLLLYVPAGTDAERRARAARPLVPRAAHGGDSRRCIAKWEPIIGVSSAALEHPPHEDQVGLLQPRDRPHLVQRRTRQEAPRLPGVHRRPRDDALPRTQPRRALLALMDKFLPDWRSRRDQLNDAPLAQESWAE